MQIWLWPVKFEPRGTSRKGKKKTNWQDWNDKLNVRMCSFHHSVSIDGWNCSHSLVFANTAHQNGAAPPALVTGAATFTCLYSWGHLNKLASLPQNRLANFVKGNGHQVWRWGGAKSKLERRVFAYHAGVISGTNTQNNPNSACDGTRSVKGNGTENKAAVPVEAMSL